MSIDSDVNQVSTSVSPTVSRSRSEPLVPAMDSGKTGPCLNSTYYEDNSEELICRAMTSFVISLPLTPALRKSAVHTTSPFTPPGRRQKYYVVSAGKRTGVFDSWLPYVQSLTSGVSGNCQKSYATYDKAHDVYQDLKESGLLRIACTAFPLPDPATSPQTDGVGMIDPVSGGIQGEGKVTNGIFVDFIIELEEDTEASVCKDSMHMIGEDVTQIV
ncbi:hypothetical protein F5888DRAFT_1632916 [Russula emetica]|nr:hypothetical protein F5888DRAFT_1632916 [Russula emetica]